MKIVVKPAVSAVVLNSKNQVLLTKRSNKVIEPGKWCVPGGHFDGGDNWIGAIEKEVSEEVGLKIIDPILLGIYSAPELTLNENWYDSNTRQKVQFAVATFLIRRFEGEVKINDECSEWGWFELQKLPSPIITANKVQCEDAANFQGQVFLR